MIERVTRLAQHWGLTVERMKNVAREFGCLSKDGHAVLADLLVHRIETKWSPP